MKKTPLKTSNKPLKKTGFLKKTGCLLKSNSILNKNTELKKQSNKSKERWEEAREKCIQRDGGKCQICGKKGTQVHHIHLRSKRKDLLYNENNLITLCDKHHFHSGNYKYEEQTRMIAEAKHITVEELLSFAERE